MPENYRYARQSYLEWYGHLLSPPEIGDDETEDLLAALENRLEGLIFATETLTEATVPFLKASDDSLRMAAVDSLLQQVLGDLAVIQVVWDLSAAIAEQPDSLMSKWATILRENQLRTTLRGLSAALPSDIDSLAHYYRAPQPNAPQQTNANLDALLDQLSYESQNVMDTLYERCTTVGLRLIGNSLVFSQQDPDIIEHAIDILQGNQRLGAIGWGMEDESPDLARELVGDLRGLLVASLQKILVIIEENDLVQYTIHDWLESLHEAPAIQRKTILQGLLDQLFQIQPFYEHELPIWLQDATTPSHVQTAIRRVHWLEEQFDRFSSIIRQVGSTADTNRALNTPSLVNVDAAIQIGLLAMLVFGAYDHMDDGRQTLNLTQGVREILIETLPVSPQTRELGQNVKLGLVRP